MKELKLITWDRFYLLQTIPKQGATRDVRKHLRLLDLLELTEEEKALVGWREVQTMTPKGPATSATWGNKEQGAQVDADHIFVIEIEDADATHLKQLADKYAGWPTHRNTLLLEDKLKEM